MHGGVGCASAALLWEVRVHVCKTARLSWVKCTEVHSVLSPDRSNEPRRGHRGDKSLWKAFLCLLDGPSRDGLFVDVCCRELAALVRFVQRNPSADKMLSMQEWAKLTHESRQPWLPDDGVQELRALSYDDAFFWLPFLRRCGFSHLGESSAKPALKPEHQALWSDLCSFLPGFPAANQHPWRPQPAGDGEKVLKPLKRELPSAPEPAQLPKLVKRELPSDPSKPSQEPELPGKPVK